MSKQEKLAALIEAVRNQHFGDHGTWNDLVRAISDYDSTPAGSGWRSSGRGWLEASEEEAEAARPGARFFRQGAAFGAILKAAGADLKGIVAKFNPSQPRDKLGRWSATHSAADVLAIVKASPQMAAANDRTDDDWERYAAKWGISGEFAKTEVDSETLLKWVDTGILGASRKLSEETIAAKQAGKSPIGPTIITRTPNERAQTFVVDGTHSLAARVRSYQKASADARDFSKSVEERRAAKKIRDANEKTEVIISRDAADYLNVGFPSKDGEKSFGADLFAKNCGTGAGGFKPGNVCAGGGGD